MSAAPPGDIEILSLGDRARWERVEAAGAVPSQCWRFANALTLSGYEPRLAIVDSGGSRLLLPYVERRWHGHTDIATIPGLAGASIVPASAVPLDIWYEFAARAGWVTGYIQLSAASYPNVPPQAHPVHQTFMFLLDPCAWNLHQTASLIIRRKVTAALRAGAVISEDREMLAECLGRLYPDMLQWFGATPRVSAATLDAWARDPRNLLVGVVLEGRIEGVHLIHVHDVTAEFHIAAMSRRGRGLSALLYASVIERLKAMRVTRCNLGGGGNPGDGLYKFKSWLGATAVPLQSIRHVYDARQYDALCATAGVSVASGWFPAYRSGDAHQAKG
jgi:hypothetical protein